jgi:hypothetical protein
MPQPLSVEELLSLAEICGAYPKEIPEEHQERLIEFGYARRVTDRVVVTNEGLLRMALGE